MKIIERIRGKVAPPVKKFHGEAETGAYGGVLSRISPTTVGNIFSFLPTGIRQGGASTPIAARPPRAPMLESADFHSLIPSGSGFVKQTWAKSWSRVGPTGVHSAAVDQATHIDSRTVHPTTKRKQLRG